MRIKILSATLLFSASPAMAAPITETWIAPGGGINAEKSKIVAPGTTLNGKTVLDAMTQIDANATAASSAQTTANAAIPLTQKDAVNGVPASTNSNLWTGTVSAIGTPTGGGFVASDLPVAYTTTSGGGVGAVAVVDAAQASQAVVWSAGVCPASTTVHLQINGTTYATADISGTTTQGQVLTLTPSSTVSASDIPDSVSSFLSSDVENCTTTPQVYTYWTPTHATITSPGKGYTSLPTFVSAQSSVASLAQSTLTATSLQTAQTAPSLDALIGAPSGVAPLDVRGQVTYPVNSETVNASVSSSVGHQDALPLMAPWNGWQGSYGAHKPGPRVTVGVPITDMADQMAMFGGHRLYDSVFSKFYALPYGVGDQGGCVHSSLMTFAPGTGAGCGAGGWDAITEYELAANNPPWYMAGSEMPDENGVGHAVTFTATGAYIRPSLPSSYKQFMHVGAHVITNIVAGPTVYGGEQLADPVATHRNQDQQFYGNTLSTWTDGTDTTGTYTYLSMTSQWQPAAGGETVTSGHVPAVGSSNGVSTDALDTAVYTDFQEPILVIGTYLKHFTRNTSCEVTVKSGTDGGSVGRYGPSRKCDEELDNWYTGPDYGATMHGLTISGGFNNKVSTDSYGISVAGPWPVGIRSWLGTDGYDFDGDEFVTGSRKGPAGTIGTTKMMAQFFQEPMADIGYLEPAMLWSQVDTLTGYVDSSTGATTARGQDISYWFGPRQSATKYNVNGSFESALVLNPGWAKNGAALCGINAASNSITTGSTAGVGCFTVDSSGNASTNGALSTGNISVSAGDSVAIAPSSGNYIPYIYAPNDTTIALSNNAGPYVGIKALGTSSLGSTTITGTETVTGASTFSGNASFSEDVSIAGGKSLTLSPASGSGNPFLYASAGNVVTLSSDEGQYVGFSALGNNAFGSTTITGTLGVSGVASLSGGLVIPFGTPASSSASCTQGQLEMDATYLYSCVSTNTWNRTANGATW